MPEEQRSMARKDRAGTQVSDDIELLTLMLGDHQEAPTHFQATTFWQNYEKRFLPELYKRGLRDFRRRKNSVLSSFGATAILEPTRLKIPVMGRWLNLWLSTHLHGDFETRDFFSLCFEFSKLYGRERGAKPIEELTPSLMGNPEAVIEAVGKSYPISILNYYLRYAYCCPFLNFDSIHVVTELGSGSGKQIEVLKKLHPRLCFFVFDIPPQLYVCEQYLKAVFPNDVISYRQTKSMSKMTSVEEGKIYIFGTRKFPILESAQTDLFWNAASLQEIEPEAAQRYLGYVNKYCGAVYLHEWMSGVKKKGEEELVVQTQLKHYEQALTHFKMIDLSPAYIVPKMRRSEIYKDSFWSQKISNSKPSLQNK